MSAGRWSPLYPLQEKSPSAPPPASGLQSYPAACFSPHGASRPPLAAPFLQPHPPPLKWERGRGVAVKREWEGRGWAEDGQGEEGSKRWATEERGEFCRKNFLKHVHNKFAETMRKRTSKLLHLLYVSTCSFTIGIFRFTHSYGYEDLSICKLNHQISYFFPWTHGQHITICYYLIFFFLLVLLDAPFFYFHFHLPCSWRFWGCHFCWKQRSPWRKPLKVKKVRSPEGVHCSFY